MSNEVRYSPDDEAFLDQIIMELYDAEVAKHPEGITADEAKAAIFDQVREIIRNIPAYRA